MTKHAFITLALALMAPLAAEAAVFTPTFNTPDFPGTQYDVTSVENDYYATTFGLKVSNAYLYKDARDTFDGVGIANGLVSANYTANQVGRVDFLDTTDFVSIDYLAILSGTYAAYDKLGTLISSFAVAPGEGTQVLTGGLISYITFAGEGGFLTISGMTYNYDGTTDGTNDDIGASPVPLPAGGMLLLAAMGGLAALRRRRA